MTKLITVTLGLLLYFGLHMLHAECGTWTEKECLKALKNSHWQTRYEMLLSLRDCPAGRLTPKIQNAVIEIVDVEMGIEAKWYEAEKAGKNPSGLGEEYGFYEMVLQEVLFKMADNPDSMDALLASMSISGWDFDKRLIDTYGQKLVPGLIRQFNNPKVQLAGKVKYFHLIGILNESEKLSSESYEKVKDIVLHGLASSNAVLQKSAIKTAVTLDYHDEEVVGKIEGLSDKKILKHAVNTALTVLRLNRARNKSDPPTAVSVASDSVKVPLSGTTTGQVPNAGNNSELQKSTTPNP